MFRTTIWLMIKSNTWPAMIIGESGPRVRDSLLALMTHLIL